MAHYCPGPQTQKHSAGTALPVAEGRLQLSVPAQLGTAQGGRAILWLPRLHGLGKRKLPESSQGRQCRTTNTWLGWAPAAQTADREMAPRTAPNQWEFEPEGERSAVWELEPAASRGMKNQRGEHTAETNPLYPPALSLQPLSPPIPAPVSRAGQSLQKAQQVPKSLPRSSSGSPAAGGLIPRLESNQSLTQGRESPFI